MGLSTGNVQAAMLATLRGDATLLGLLGNPSSAPYNIFDAGAPPTSYPFPYIAMFTITAKKGTLFVMGLDATDVFPQVSGFTKYGGFSQARGIMARVYFLLDQKPLTLLGTPPEGGVFTNPLILFDQAMERENGEMGIQQIDHRYKVFTQG